MGMKCITYLIDTHEEGEPAPFEEDYGTGNLLHSATFLILIMIGVQSSVTASLKRKQMVIITEFHRTQLLHYLLV